MEDSLSSIQGDVGLKIRKIWIAVVSGRLGLRFERVSDQPVHIGDGDMFSVQEDEAFLCQLVDDAEYGLIGGAYQGGEVLPA
jgi:hypothetical protein